MKHSSTTIEEDRALTAEEQTLVRWLLEHGERHAPAFISQLADARVIGRCPCGCASIDFSVAGVRPPTAGGIDILSDYCWQDTSGHRFGAFVFSRNGRLAGLDLWSVDGVATATYLPHPDQLTPRDS